MSRHQHEYVGALLDGELKGLRRLVVVRHLRICPVCASEYRRVRHVRRMMRESAPAVQMSDSATFFWSKVRDEIERRGEQKIALPAPHLTLGDWLFQHQAALATVTALLVLALAGVWTWSHRSATASTAQFAEVQKVSTSIPNTVATPFRSTEADVTVIWVSGLPWTRDMTEMKTLYASLDS